MKIEYQIFKEEKLLLLKFSGEWSFSNYKKLLNKFVQIEDIELVDKVLSDFREVISDPSVGDIKELADIREKIIRKKYNHVRIVTNPFVTALAHLYKDELNTRGYIDNYCSTIERAVELLNLKFSAKEIENLLKNLENKL